MYHLMEAFHWAVKGLKHDAGGLLEMSTFAVLWFHYHVRLLLVRADSVLLNLFTVKVYVHVSSVHMHNI